jgi:5-methylcytosine-specific restriction endonuclease McrA
MPVSRARWKELYRLRYAAHIRQKRAKEGEAHRVRAARNVMVWKLAHPETVHAWREKRRTAIREASTGTITTALVQRMLAAAETCIYCGCEVGERDKSIDHIKPLAVGGAHCRFNLAVCCRRCNLVKGPRSVGFLARRLALAA